MGTTFRLPFLATPPYIYIVFANALLEGNTTHWIWTLLQFESREILLIKNVFVSLAWSYRVEEVYNLHILATVYALIQKTVNVSLRDV